ncbi:hypothetical protein Ac2012v2_007127 [Leucoagaricus gongylophorus]
MAMLDHAPTNSGKRYVATCLAIARTKRVDAVTEVADQWLEHMFFKMLPVSRATTIQPTASFTPNFNNTAQQIEKADHTEQEALRESVQRRERDHCAITGVFDYQVARTLKSQRLPVPLGSRLLEAAHIILLSLNGFEESHKLNLNWQYPDNPNKYKAQGSHSSYRFFYGEVTIDVEFPAKAESMVKPPDPEIIRIHAAFARVLSLSGAIDYLMKWSGVLSNLEDSLLMAHQI